MRQVRKKSADPTARTYFLKARQEGLELSWNRYERMLPQDGFGKLGLTCGDCLQGPCRLNPFSREEERTICGRDKDTLVYNNLQKLLSLADGSKQDVAGDKGLSPLDALVKTAQAGIEHLKNNRNCPRLSESVTQIGLGVLAKEKVNICLEAVSPAILEMSLELKEKLEEEALTRGAQGFHLVLAADVTAGFPVPTVSNAGGVEFALLTGLVDLYVVGPSRLGLGKNVVPAYHTVYREAGFNADYDILKDWFIQAAVAYSKREKEKILEAEQRGEARLLTVEPASLKAHLEQGTIRKLAILGGGSSVLLTEDALLCEAAAQLAGEHVLNLAYGNAAATLGKHGLLAPGSAGASPQVTAALGLTQGSPAYWLGSEEDIAEILSLVEYVGSVHVLALYPELSTPADLRNALALAAQGVPVFTAVKLPADGSETAAQELSALIRYCQPQDFLAEVKAKLQA
jgi:carbon-monoxide dehydrogenase catalytic subunit